MIIGFAHRGLKRLYERGDGRQLHPELVPRIQTILGRLDTAEKIEDMDIHTFNLHPLKGDLKGFWSVTVRANWRIIFRFKDGEADDVDFLDYHGD